MPENVAGTLLAYLSGAGTLLLPVPKTAAQAAAEMQEALSDPERDGGVTFSLYFGDQWEQSFYAVGLDNDLTRTAEPTELAEALAVFLQAHRDLLTHPRCCIGVWQTRDADGVETAWIDVAVLVYNETHAREFARTGNQIALYDLRQNGVGEIAIGGTGQSSIERLHSLDAQDRPGQQE